MDAAPDPSSAAADADPERLLRAATVQVQELVTRAFDDVRGVAPPGSALDQLGLRDGDRIVAGYLEHGEPGVAFEHLLYRVEELDFPLPRATFALLEAAGRALRMDEQRWESLRARVAGR
jgi:hypothetical protein